MSRRRAGFVVVTTALVLSACGGSPAADSDTTDEGLLLPPVGAVADYQLGGAYEPDDVVEVVVRDRTADPADGRYSICYVNGFQTQPGELELWEQEHPELLLRDPDSELVIDPDWPDEVLLDLSSQAKREQAAAVVGGWIRGCAEDGFAAVEIDNLDTWTRSGDLLTQDAAEAYATLLVEVAHDAGLPIGQKNSAELDGRSLGFDFAVTEECAVYDECDVYTDLYGGHVIEIEYTDNGREAFAEACDEASGERSIMLRDRDLVPDDDPAHVFEHC